MNTIIGPTVSLRHGFLTLLVLHIAEGDVKRKAIFLYRFLSTHMGSLTTHLRPEMEKAFGEVNLVQLPTDPDGHFTNLMFSKVTPPGFLDLIAFIDAVRDELDQILATAWDANEAEYHSNCAAFEYAQRLTS